MKVRGTGFAQLYAWLADRDLLIVRADRAPPLVVLPLTLAVEIAMFAAGVWLYLSCTRARDRVSVYAWWSFVLVLMGSYLANAFGPPPPSATFLAWFGLGLWLFPFWAAWVDRHRIAFSLR